MERVRVSIPKLPDKRYKGKAKKVDTDGVLHLPYRSTPAPDLAPKQEASRQIGNEFCADIYDLGGISA